MNEQAFHAIYNSVDSLSTKLVYWPKQALNFVFLATLGFVALVLFGVLFAAYAMVCVSICSFNYVKEKMGVSPDYNPLKELTESIRELVTTPNADGPAALVVVPSETPEQGVAVPAASEVPDFNLDNHAPGNSWSPQLAFAVKREEAPACVPDDSPAHPSSYTEKDLSQAVSDVLEGKESVRGASRKYKVPYTTLNKAVKKAKQI